MSSSGITPAPATPPDATAVVPHTPDPWIGRKLKKYAIVARLGQGGMGVVYLAEDTILRRVVAIKMIAQGLAGDAQGFARFRREAQAAARLQHANVASIYEMDEDQGVHYLVMEFVPGPSAAQIVEREGGLPWRQATQIVLEACRGLAAAHGAKLIHRDIKPANILVSQTGEVKLSDFGLAKSVADKETQVTLGKQVLGTPQYMSPEQGRNDELDERSDIYSLGATYYALLTGAAPFPGKDVYATIYAHISQPMPDPRVKKPDIPEACVKILETALAKHRGDRFADASAMAEALEAALGPTRESLGTLAQSFEIAQPTGASAFVTPNIQHSRFRLPRSWIALAGAIAGLTFLALAILACSGTALWFFFPRPVIEDSPEKLRKELIARNPGFDGKFDLPVMRKGRIVKLTLDATKIKDVTPLGELTELEELDLTPSNPPACKLGEVASLGKLTKVKRLRVHGCPEAADFTFLTKLKALTHLDVAGTRIKSLEPLRGLPIVQLKVGFGTAIEDLRGLEECPLEELDAGFAYHLKSLNGLPIKHLRWLSFESTLVPSLEGIENADKVEHLNFAWTTMTKKQRRKQGKEEIAGPLLATDRKILRSLNSLNSITGEFTPEEEAQIRPQLRAAHVDERAAGESAIIVGRRTGIPA